jgi:hypothetical protein
MPAKEKQVEKKKGPTTTTDVDIELNTYTSFARRVKERHT